MGRPEQDFARQLAMSVLGPGLAAGKHYEDALVVQEAELSMLRRLGALEVRILAVQANLACTYARTGRLEEAMCLRRDINSGRRRLDGEEHEESLRAANNYASSLYDLKRYGEAKTLLRKTISVARRVRGDSRELTLKMRWLYAVALHHDPDATLDDVREAVETLESVTPSWKRIFGPAHPETAQVQVALKNARRALAARAAASSSGAA